MCAYLPLNFQTRYPKHTYFQSEWQAVWIPTLPGKELFCHHLIIKLILKKKQQTTKKCKISQLAKS